MENQPEVLLGCVSNLWSKMMHFKQAGDVEPGHKHLFDHMTLLAHGSLRVSVDGESTDFKAPHMIFIRAGKYHELEALEDGTLAYCIHALRDGERVEDIIDPSMIPANYANPYEFAKPLIHEDDMKRAAEIDANRKS